MGKEIAIISAGEKNKTIKVYDMENEIISYQATITELFSENVIGNHIYLLTRVGTSKTTQVLKEKSNIEKLECFIRKKSYDVAYKFAKNEKFSEEVLADISRYYGDFLYGKVRRLMSFARQCTRKRWRSIKTRLAI